MGCDIHLYREKKVNGNWIAADEFVDEYNDGVLDVPWEKRFTDRDYDLFGFLCSGVRRQFEYSLHEKGLPGDISQEVKAVSDRWGSDGHSHSHLTIAELKQAWVKIQSLKTPITGMMQKDQLDKLKESINSDSPNYDLIYPYCMSTNAPDYVAFKIDLPASYALSGVERIINLFDGCDGDDHRIVFWFDN